jgi:hypothetical protein
MTKPKAKYNHPCTDCKFIANAKAQQPFTKDGYRITDYDIYIQKKPYVKDSEAIHLHFACEGYAYLLETVARIKGWKSTQPMTKAKVELMSAYLLCKENGKLS